MEYQIRDKYSVKTAETYIAWLKSFSRNGITFKESGDKLLKKLLSMKTKYGSEYSRNSLIGGINVIVSLYDKGILKLTKRQFSPIREWFD